MDLLEEKSWIDQLELWIEGDEATYSKTELQRLLAELEIAVTMADSLAECSDELKRITDQWIRKT
jgi:hypothetical protein